MWGSQGWNQWALQPAMFNDVPHEQIDWAALAKQWIQMQQTQPPDSMAASALPTVTPSASAAVQPITLPLPPGHSPLAQEEFHPEPSMSTPLLKTPVIPGAMPEPFQTERSFDAEPVSYVAKSVSNTYWSKSQWEASAAGDVDERMWPTPSEPAASIIGGKETFDYGHMHDNPPLAMQSIDYNHMSDFQYNQAYQPESQYDQYWSQVNAAPPITPIFLKKERTSSSSTSRPVEEDTSQIDAAKRKHLPAWIREGLEKMEQERLKRLEKEKAEKEKVEKLAQAKLKKELDIKEDTGPLMPVKSKFEDDSDVEEEAENSTNEKSSPVVQRSPSPIEDFRTEEEKRQEKMLQVRRLLTEILLSVTNSEMYAIAEEVLKKEKLKARQLASTASLTSVASGLRGLANYGTESEASEVEEDKDESDSDEELHRRIREKKKLFAVKGKKILAELEKKELERQKEALKAKNDNLKPVESEPEEIEKNAEQFEKPKEESPLLAMPPAAEISEQVSSEIPFMNEKSSETPVEVQDINDNSKKELKKPDKDSPFSDSSSSSSESGSESSEKHKKKSNKNEHERKVSDTSKRSKDKSPPTKHHRRSRSSDSDSSDRHRKSHRSNEKSKKSSSYKKKKKYKRSDSSSSSSSSSRKRKCSSKSEPGHNYSREHSHDGRDRKHNKHSLSPKHYRSSRDSHRSRDSYSHRYETEKYIRRDKEDRYDYKRSPSPHRRSSKLPKKYRSSRSPSFENEYSGKKLKKSRNR